MRLWLVLSLGLLGACKMTCEETAAAAVAECGEPAGEACGAVVADYRNRCRESCDAVAKTIWATLDKCQALLTDPRPECVTASVALSTYRRLCPFETR